jgi:hypothetical protein
MLLLTLALGAGFAHAQTPTGTIQGTVGDEQGAVVVGATVTATNNATGISKQVATDGSGRFEVLFVLPGTYTVTAEAKGFRQEKRENVVVEVSKTVPLALTLSIGQASQTVEVIATAGALETDTSSLNTVIATRSITDLPLNGRNPFSLETLVPGVSNVGNASTPHIGGSRNANNEMLIDGMTNILPENNVGNNETAYQPIVDSVQEFSVQTSVLPAEYGRFSGGAISLVTKSGGDHYHGTLFEFIRNGALDAEYYTFNGAAGSQPPLHRYQTGGTIGGPVPLIDKAKRTFFFFAYENSQFSNGSGETDSVPQPQWLKGDFSDLIPPGTNCNATPVAGCIYDPNTVALVGGQYVRQAFPGNMIPMPRWSTVAQNALTYYPAPNVASQVCSAATPSGCFNNYTITGSNPDNYYHYDARLDHDFGTKWHSFFRFSHWVENNLGGNSLSDYGNAASQGYGGPAHITEWSGTFNNTFNISPTWLGEIRYGVSRQAYARSTFGQPFDLASLGFPASYVSTASIDGLIFPRFDVGNGYSGLGPNGYNSYYENPLAHDVQGSLVKIAGAHTVKFGAEFRKLYENFAQYGQPSGEFAVDQSWTQQIAGNANSTGNPFASFLLGLQNTGYMTHDPTAADASGYFGLFVQDDWKVKKNLTLNLGLRWDVEIPRTERFNRLSVWDPNLPSPLQAEVTVPTGVSCPACSSLMGQMLFAGTPSDPWGRSQAPIQWHDFAPRIGFAYNPLDKLVVRGGFGLVFAPSALQAAGTSGSPGIEGFSSQTQFTSTFDNQQSAPSAATLDTPAPSGFNLPQGASGGAGTDLGTGISDSYFGSVRNPYSEQWNLNVQYALPAQTTLEVGYLGNHGLFLIDGDPGYNYDQLPTADLALGNALLTQVPNPFYGLITVPGNPLSEPTVQANYLLRPYPQYNGVQSFRKPQSASRYNAFTLKLDKHFSHGLSMLVSYTNAKLFDNSASAVNYLGPASQTFANAYAPQNEWSVSAQDVSQMLVVSYVYELPFGRGKAFLGESSGVVNRLVGGWQTVGIVTWTTGTPVVLGAAINQTNIFTFAQRPDWTGADPRTSGQTLNHWFNTSVYSQPAEFTIGSAPRTIANVRNPGVSDCDLSFFKNNYFGAENRYNLQFRVEMFNAFNHPQFGAPDAGVNDGNFGVISSMGTNYNPRNIQLALKFNF